MDRRVPETKKSGFCNFLFFSLCARWRFSLSASDITADLGEAPSTTGASAPGRIRPSLARYMLRLSRPLLATSESLMFCAELRSTARSILHTRSLMLRPPFSWAAFTHAEAKSGVINLTNAVPLDISVTLSFTTSASEMRPYLPSANLMSLESASNGRPRINTVHPSCTSSVGSFLTLGFSSSSFSSSSASESSSDAASELSEASSSPSLPSLSDPLSSSSSEPASSPSSASLSSTSSFCEATLSSSFSAVSLPSVGSSAFLPYFS